MLRLSYVAKKLNIGIKTIIDFLGKKGFEIGNTLNTKITEEQYQLLTEKFLKKESNDVSISTTSNSNQEDKAFKEFSASQKKYTYNIPQQDTSTINQDEEEKLQSTHRFIKDSRKQSSIKVLGKVNLEKPESSFTKETSYTQVVTPKGATYQINDQKNITKTGQNTNKSSENVNLQKEEKYKKDYHSKYYTNNLFDKSGLFNSFKKPRKNIKTKKKKGEKNKIQQTQYTGLKNKKKETISLTRQISAQNLSSLIDVEVNKILKFCLNLGSLISINQKLDEDLITLVLEEFGYKPQFIDLESIKDNPLTDQTEFDQKDLIQRPPIVTIMGHVDHGKTSLLDFIRETNATKQEIGGITQHIGAYDITKNNTKITFLDTPGHEAFTAMRSRGVKITDIAIIVIAADDGVMPQTREAINHVKAANVPIIIAINKIDKPDSNVEKVITELAHMNILVETWGGKVQMQEISAKTGKGIDELLEKVILEADLLVLKANPKLPAKGVVLESSLDKTRGYLTNLIIQTGTLYMGDYLLIGPYYGKVKALFNHEGLPIKKAIPSMPAQILGFSEAPHAGEEFAVANSEKEAKGIASSRASILKEQKLKTKKHITLEKFAKTLSIKNFQSLNLIIKADTHGSVEAIADALLQLSTEKMQVQVLHKEVGPIVESDILLAASSNALVIGFHIRPIQNVRELANKEDVEIRLYNIIYEIIQDIKNAITGTLQGDKKEEKIIGTAEVKEIFKMSKIGTVAGSYVREGYLKKSHPIRLIRDGLVIYEGNIDQLKIFQDTVLEVKKQQECGITIEKFNDIKQNDIIESFIVESKTKN